MINSNSLIKYALKFLIGILLLCKGLISQAQTDTTKQSQNNFKEFIGDLPFLFDDIFITAGINRSGLFWSLEHNGLKYGSNFQVGIESQLPTERFFFTYGLHYVRSTFHYHNELQQELESAYFAAPLLLSFELPELQSVDWRVIVGLQAQYRLNTKSSNHEPAHDDQFSFNPDEFTQFDAGIVFGTSAEYRNMFFRARTVLGTSRVSKQKQGSLSTFHFEIGYFLFRPLRNRFAE